MQRMKLWSAYHFISEFPHYFATSKIRIWPCPLHEKRVYQDKSSRFRMKVMLEAWLRLTVPIKISFLMDSQSERAYAVISYYDTISWPSEMTWVIVNDSLYSVEHFLGPVQETPMYFKAVLQEYRFVVAKYNVGCEVYHSRCLKMHFRFQGTRYSKVLPNIKSLLGPNLFFLVLVKLVILCLYIYIRAFPAI